MKDKPCQKGNQPCFCNASLSNLSFAFFTRYAYTNFPVTLFNNFFLWGLAQYTQVDEACSTLHFSTSKPISQYHPSTWD